MKTLRLFNSVVNFGTPWHRSWNITLMPNGLLQNTEISWYARPLLIWNTQHVVTFMEPLWCGYLEAHSQLCLAVFWWLKVFFIITNLYVFSFSFFSLQNWASIVSWYGLENKTLHTKLSCSTCWQIGKQILMRDRGFKCMLFSCCLLNKSTEKQYF